MAITPFGIGSWVFLNKPNKNKKYSVQVKFEGQAAKDFKKAIDEAVEDNFTKKQLKEGNIKIPYKEISKGVIEATFSNNAEYKAKDGSIISSRPIVMDAKAQPIPKDIIPGTGSKLRVKYDAWVYDNENTGLGLRLKEVQIKELVPYVPVAKEDESFEEVDGYVAGDEGSAELDDDAAAF